MNLDDRANEAMQKQPCSNASVLKRLSTSLNKQEIDDACEPHPHIFQCGEQGLFPIGEVTILAAPGRAGKTTMLTTIVTMLVRGEPLVGLSAKPDSKVLIYSAEDSRKQFARKLGAQFSLRPEGQSEALGSIYVPDLDHEAMNASKELVSILDGSPAEALQVDAIIEAFGDLSLDLIIFETASTLNHAGEDNNALAVLCQALKRIARRLNAAVVLTHHTSQAAASQLPKLNVSVADVRGATSLTNNSRQNLMVVDLGSDAEPFPDSDLRTILRHKVAQGREERVTALIALDSSKSVSPAPIFMAWKQTEKFGAAMECLPTPPDLQGKQWLHVRTLMLQEHQSVSNTKRQQEKEAKVNQVVEIVRTLESEGAQPTARKVSDAAGMSPGWAKPYLIQAVSSGLLVCAGEPVPHTSGLKDVYRPADQSGAL